nr:MAG TPA: hypothetical protein [Caudoviricetes sp.]
MKKTLFFRKRVFFLAKKFLKCYYFIIFLNTRC